LVPTAERLYPVGRLDRDSEGLLLLTNDGALAERMLHPRYGMHRRYRVEVLGLFSERDLARLRAGVQLEDGLSRPLRAEVIRRSERVSTLDLVLGEGRNRQIRRTLEALGKRVHRLVRLSMGPIELGDLGSGHCRELTPTEVEALRWAVGLDGPES
ncbi:MAG: pseudouridine synthase, partial [Chloroflexota bacterium]|nr:pseudouridine synthase [Chloroflexota bacterium]